MGAEVERAVPAVAKPVHYDQMGTKPERRGDVVIVGYALTEKKCRSLFSPELIGHARSVPSAVVVCQEYAI